MKVLIIEDEQLAVAKLTQTLNKVLAHDYNKYINILTII